MLKVEILGNLGADAYLRRDNDSAFVSFNVCHTDRYTDRATGQVMEVSQWVSCTLNGEQKNLLPYLKQGVKVFVRGFLSSRLFLGKDGKQHAGLNCGVTEIELAGSRVSVDSVKRFIDESPESRQIIYDHLIRYADQNQPAADGEVQG